MDIGLGTQASFGRINKVMVTPLPVSELNKSGSNAPLVQIDRIDRFAPIRGHGATKYRHSYDVDKHLDSLLIVKDSDSLVVQFHGAVNRDKVELPRFERLATLSQRSHSSMFFADPGLWLDPEITITWYTGWGNFEPQQDIAEMIIKTANDLGVSNVIIVGDSGGGFAALQVSALVPDSVCVTFNPTTTIYNYFTSGNVRRTEVQTRYVETVHPEIIQSQRGDFNPKIDWTTGLGDGVSVLKRYSKNTSNYVIFIQNTNDWHYGQHYLPFLAAAARGNNLSRVRGLEYEGRKGHFSPSQELYLRGVELGEEAVRLRAMKLPFDTLDVSELKEHPATNTDLVDEGEKGTTMERRKIVLTEGAIELPDSGKLDDLAAQANLKSGVYSIGAETPIIARWQNKDSAVTLVTFSAALTKNAAPTVPIFSGRRTTSDLKSNVLMISDPSLILSKDLMLGWYAGNAVLGEVQSEIAKIISVFAGDTRLVLFGASGGGFAALDQATRLPGATALVINPQTDITKYPYYSRYKEIVWGDKYAGPSEESLPIRTNVLDEYSTPVDARVIYVQNVEDKHHFVDQMKPFKTILHPQNDVIFVERELGQGHFGPDAASMTKLFELVTEVADSRELEGLLSDVDLVSVKP